MTPKFWLFIVLIGVLAPVYLLFGVATSENVKEMSEKNKEEIEKNRAKHRYMVLGQSWGMGIERNPCVFLFTFFYYFFTKYINGKW